MRDDMTIFVDCLRDGNVIRIYDFLCPASLATPPVVPPNDHFIEQASVGWAKARSAVPTPSALAPYSAWASLRSAHPTT
jgi:hypothetical protein